MDITSEHDISVNEVTLDGMKTMTPLKTIKQSRSHAATGMFTEKRRSMYEPSESRNSRQSFMT